MGILSECQVVLDIDSSLPFKKKVALKRKIIDHGGVVSFIVTKKVREERGGGGRGEGRGREGV